MNTTDKIIKRIKQTCNRCGKEPVADIKNSNENWTVYPTQCQCGGKFEIKLETESPI